MKLKNAPAVWGKVYIKKDEHPVYTAEYNRLCREFKKLKEKNENTNKTVAFKAGKIFIDGVIVDKNTFFS